MAAAATAIAAPRLHSSAVTIRHRWENGIENAIHIGKKTFTSQSAVTTASSGRCFVTAASKSPNEEAISNADDSIKQDDLNFLLKLGAGSFAGAAAIKYGSVLVPEITRPNITQALIMITTPVLVAVLILIKASRVEQ